MWKCYILGTNLLCFDNFNRWLVDDSKYYENLPEDENGVSHFTLTLTKDKTGVRCEAQNHKDIDSRTAYITVPKGNSIYKMLF